MYYVSAQGIDECAVNVHYYFYFCIFLYLCLGKFCRFDLRKESFEMCF